MLEDFMDYSKKEEKPEEEIGLSEFQKNIIQHIQEKRGSLFVEAVAGSGKTFMLKQASKVIDSKSCLFLAFNKHIQMELKSKLPKHFDVRTVNALGYHLWRREQNGICEIDKNKTDRLIEEYIKRCTQKHLIFKFRGVIRKMVTFAKGAGIVPRERKDLEGFYPDVDGVWEQIIEKHGIDDKIDEIARTAKDYQQSYDMCFDFIVTATRAILNMSLNEDNVIDFDDQIYLPVIHQLAVPKFEWVLVDECQDLSPLQLELIKLCCNENSTVFGVGDPEQAIYYFRGADEHSIQKFKEHFKCTTLPLPITYRCPNKVVELAQQVNPKILKWEEAKDGTVQSLRSDYRVENFKQGQTILCRYNAPLLDMAVRIMKEGYQFQFEGRDFCNELLQLVDTFRSVTIAQFEHDLGAWKDKKKRKLQEKQKEYEMQSILDKYESLVVLSQQLGKNKELKDLKQLIRKYFYGGYGVKLSSIHKAKGLEAETIYFLDRDKLPSSRAAQPWELQAEDNLIYVGLTRSKNNLFFIESAYEFRKRYYFEPKDEKNVLPLHQ